MELASVIERTSLVDPAGSRVEQTIEHRIDPLTETVASLNSVLGEKAKAFLGTADLALLEDLQEKSKANCPFCTAAERGTRFVPEVSPAPQLRVGRSVAVPNLFSKCGLDAVVILDPALHVLFPSKLPADALGDALRASAELVRRARAGTSSLVHHVAGMNFLNPGGSSVPHPHLQVHARSVPYSGLTRAMALAAEHRARTGRSFFDALLEHERAAGARYIGRSGAVEWVAAWAPSHQREIWGVLPGTASLVDARDEDLAAFGDGIARVVSFYEESGVHPFTLAFHSSPDPARSDSWALHVKICSRPAFKALYANYDTWFTPMFLGDEVHTEAPEVYAARLRAKF
jgi:UDPglucose--hexose-1-phosphate uridylyltransferase